MLALGWLTAVTVSLTLSAQTGAVAEGRLRVLIVPVAASTSTQDALYGGFSALGIPAVEREDRGGVDLEALAAQSATSPDAARDAILAAKASFGAFDLDAARLKLVEAEGVLIGLSSPETQRDLFADLLLLQAEIALASGEQGKATTSLRRLARLQAERKALHPGLYAPALVEAYQSARQQNEEAKGSTLVLWPRAPGASDLVQLIDGERLSDRARSRILPAGPHLITVRAAQRLTRSKWVELDEGAPVVWEPLLTVPAVADARRQALEQLQTATFPSEAASTAAEALNELCGASWIVLVAPHVTAYSAATGFVDAGLPKRDPLEQARAVQLAMQSARAKIALAQAAKRAQENGTRSGLGGTTGGESTDEANYTLPLLGAGAGAATVLVLGVAASIATGAGWFWYATRVVAPPPPPPTSINVTCCSGT